MVRWFTKKHIKKKKKVFLKSADVIKFNFSWFKEYRKPKKFLKATGLHNVSQILFVKSPTAFKNTLKQIIKYSVNKKM